MVQSLVVVVHVLQDEVLLDHGLGAPDLLEDLVLLELHVHPAGGEEAAEPKAIALPPLERRGLVEERVVQNLGAAARDLDRREELLGAAGPLALGLVRLLLELLGDRFPAQAQCSKRAFVSRGDRSSRQNGGGGPKPTRSCFERRGTAR